MAAKHVIKITDIIKFFKDEEKLIRKGENAVESGHISNMTFDGDLKIVKGKVHASMRDRQYNVQVRKLLIFSQIWLLKCYSNINCNIFVFDEFKSMFICRCFSIQIGESIKLNVPVQEANTFATIWLA